MKIKNILALALCLLLLAGVTLACNTADDKTIRVGASVTPHAEILKVAEVRLLEKGYSLEIVEFTDYVQPNLAVESGELDANFFQHQPYLDDFNANNGTHIVSIASIHYEPFGIYAGKLSSLDEVSDGSTVAIPNDGTNEARALMLLEQLGWIKLNEDAGFLATKLDIAENPYNLDIIEIEAAQLARSLADVDFAIINGNYALQAGLSAKSDALAIESSDSLAATTYANVLCCLEGNEDDPALLALVEALQSAEVREYIEANYDGSVVPMF
ncbi:MAG: MetQ/NlpA family ABC transporter substrate-binding protein [Clostridia bacterium]|nr:MetQ/NlpA family ABC transporter substrate-binding protein [Clostridia bacterium]